jgi:hypothetical protein
MSGGGRTGGGRGRYNHQYSGGSNSLGGDSGRETPLDNPSQQSHNLPTMVENEVSTASNENPEISDSTKNHNNNNRSDLSTPSNKDDSTNDVGVAVAVGTNTIPIVTPSIEDTVGK